MNHRSWGRAALVVLATTLATPAALGTPPEDDLARTDLERAAFVAMPAVVRVQARVPIQAVVDGGRRVHVGGPPLTITATGFAVGLREIVVARHVAVPLDEVMLDGLRPRLGSQLAGMSSPRIVHGPVSFTLTRAETEASRRRGDPPPQQVPATVVRTSEEASDDLALLRIAQPGPYVQLADGRTAGTPVAVVGFGGRVDIVPAIRYGAIGVEADAEKAPRARLMALDVEIELGDSGAPVIAADGRVHGVVIRRRHGPHPPVATQAGVIRDMVRVPRADGSDHVTFASAMARFWALDYPGAEAELGVLRRTWPQVRLLAYEHDRANGLGQAAYSVTSRRRLLRGPLIVLGAVALIAAGTLLVIRLRMA